MAGRELDECVQPAFDIVLAALIAVLVHSDGGVAERSSESGDSSRLAENDWRIRRANDQQERK
jgi:hypothetical protein